MRPIAFVLVFLAGWLAGAERTALARLRVVATTEDLAYFARVVGGDEAEVQSILRGYQDPHFAAARPSYMVAVSRADLVLAVGLDLEVGWLPLILQGARNPDVMPGNPGFLDCSQFIAPIEVPPAGADRSKGDLHPKGNPHYWLDPDRALAVARGIAARMEQRDPAGAPRFRQGLARLEAEIAQAREDVQALLRGVDPPPLVTYHVTFSYFLERFGLRATAYIEPKPGIPPTPGHVADLNDTLSRLPHPPLFLVEPYYDPDIPKEMAGRVHGRVAVVPSSVGGVTGATTYRALLTALATAIAGK